MNSVDLVKGWSAHCEGLSLSGPKPFFCVFLVLEVLTLSQIFNSSYQMILKKVAIQCDPDPCSRVGSVDWRVSNLDWSSSSHGQSLLGWRSISKVTQSLLTTLPSLNWDKYDKNRSSFTDFLNVASSVSGGCVNFFSGPDFLSTCLDIFPLEPYSFILLTLLVDQYVLGQ